MREIFNSIFGHVSLWDDRSLILSQGILGTFKHDKILNKSWSYIIYDFEYFTCHFIHPFHMEVFDVSGL